MVRVQPPYLDASARGSGGSSSLQRPQAAAAGLHEGGGTRKSGRGGGGPAAVGMLSLPDSLDDIFTELSMSPRGGGGDSGGDGGSKSPAPVMGQTTPEKEGAAAAAAGDGNADQHRSDDGWLVINDFCVTPVTPSEVLEWYGGQKLPVLLFYTRVRRPLAGFRGGILGFMILCNGACILCRHLGDVVLLCIARSSMALQPASNNYPKN